MRVLVFSLCVTVVFGWHPCNPKHCRNVCKSVTSYCDIAVPWKDSCKTVGCGYVYEFQDLSGLHRPNPVISGTITSLRKMELELDFKMGSMPPDGADCWWYLIFPPNYGLIEHSITEKLVTSLEIKNVKEFRLKRSLLTNYTISIPCNTNMISRAPNLLIKDAIVYFFGDRNNSTQNVTEYTLNWTAALTNFSNISEIYDTSRSQTTTPVTEATSHATTEKQHTTTTATASTQTTAADITSPNPQSSSDSSSVSQTSGRTSATSKTTSKTTTLTATTRPIFVEEAPKQLKNVSEKLFDSQQKTQNRTFTDPVELEEIVEQVIKTTSELTEILEDPETPQQLSTDVAISYMEGAADTTTSLVSSENADTWQMVSDKTTVLNNIIEALDEVKDALIESLIPSEIVEVEIKQRKTLSLAIFPENTKGKSLDVAPSNNVRIGISDEVLTGLADDSPVIVAANVYTGAEECYAEIPSQEVDIFNEIDSPKTTSDNAPFRVLTQIVSVNLRPKLVDGYYVTLKFNHTQEPPRTQNYSIFCGYINKTTNKWTNEKCRVIATNMNSTTIQSDHLTNFAILMQVVDFQVPEFHLQNLSLITYIGSAISIFCLVLALCVFALVKNPTGNPNDNVRGHRTERYHLHANLALAILLGQVTFLVGANYEPKTASCKATAILLHFFYMSAFSWMFVEGLHLYNLVVKVFRSARSRLHYYYIIGWGTPLLICVISVAAAYQGYGEIKNCWLDTENSKVIWAFVGPALVVVVVNILILVKVVRIITNLAKSQENCINCMTDKTTVVVCAKAIAILLPILGVTWVFGVLAVNEDTIVFQYLFAICNSLQGFFLFMFHCVFNSETRTSLKYKTKSFRADLQSRTITSTRSAKKATKVELVKSAEIVSEEPPVGLSDTATTAFNTNNNSNGYATPDRSRASSRTDYFSAPGKKNGYRQWRNDAPGTPTGRLSASSRKIDPNVGQAW